MSLLRLEELESRQLLNATYVAPLPRPSASDHQPTWVGEPPRGGDFGGPTQFEWRGGPAGSGWDPGRPSFNAGTPLVIEFIVITFAQPEHDGTASGSYTAGATINTPAANPKPTASDAGSIAAAVDVVSSRAVVAAPTARVSPQTPFMLVPPVTVPTVITEVQGPTAIPLSARSIRPGDGMAANGPAWLTQGAAATAAPAPIPAADDSEPAEGRPTESTFPGVLAALPTMDLAALGHDLQQFLARIERAGEELVGDGDGLRPWLVAGAAAATACEIARRQMQRSEDRGQRTIRHFGSASDL